MNDKQVGPFNPADLDRDGTFNADKFFTRLRGKHGYQMELPFPPPPPDPNRFEKRTLAARKGDRLRALGVAVPLCSLPDGPAKTWLDQEQGNRR